MRNGAKHTESSRDRMSEAARARYASKAPADRAWVPDKRKYSVAQVRDIRRLRADGWKQVAIAAAVGVPLSTVEDVLQGRSYRDVT